MELPSTEMGKSERWTNLRRKIKCSALDLLNLKCQSDNKVQILITQLGIKLCSINGNNNRISGVPGMLLSNLCALVLSYYPYFINEVRETKCLSLLGLLSQKYRILCDLNIKQLFFTVLQAKKSQIKGPEDSVSDKNMFPGS